MSEEPRWGYEAGPSDAMKKEIGQVVINHALCDAPLMSLFMVLSGTDRSTAYTLINSLNLKAGGMTKAILDLAKQRQPAVAPELLERLVTTIGDYRKLSFLRNEVAHWQWGLATEGDQTATASNIMRISGDGTEVSKEFTLQTLEKLSVGLIITYSSLSLFSGMMAQPIPSFALTQAFKQLDEISAKVKEALLGLPEPEAGELP